MSSAPRTARTASRIARFSSSASSSRDAHPWISGRFDQEASISYAAKLAITDPARASQIGSIAIPTSSQVQKALDHANSVFASGHGEWSSPDSVHFRSECLYRLAQILRQRAPELAMLESQQTGRCIREFRAQLARLYEWFEYYSALIRVGEGSTLPLRGQLLGYKARRPLGVVLQITPFNHPLLIAVKKLAAALAAGNSVIVKPSEVAPLTVLELGPMTQEAGIPDGVVQILPGAAETAKQLVESPYIRKIDFTGGTRVGTLLSEQAGKRLIPITTELGGKAPLIVMEDCPVDLAVNGASFAAFVASGQTCVSATRISVHEKIFTAFLDRFAERANNISSRMGNPQNADALLGSLISAAHADKVDAIVQGVTTPRRSSASVWECVAGGRKPNGASFDGHDLAASGAFYPPTILIPAGTSSDPSSLSSPAEQAVRSSTLWQEEVFGPVVCVVPFRDDAHAIELANDSRFGLGASVWTADHARFHRMVPRIKAGIVWLNTHHRNDPSSPWGAIAPTGNFSGSGTASLGANPSGIGRENGLEALNAYSTVQSITINYADHETMRSSEDWFGPADKGAASSQPPVRYG
ncbi:Aldehyde dehydrogenase [Kalmanozyma brasiliensis GHG001]|uniref:Aldehyde dehydrogenase n=1 Tax=Kalmanozyma brasiliensis (strain GHG001) TaxID=1365824 RepID=UPI001CE89FAB|nr:Aldehyde dehydrogenase [Kalmanozyma brasiliensis GHG001]EST09339.2 Aldehyde dehydrogenase [Kalmanozyma brasiliensis GHG001]